MSAEVVLLLRLFGIGALLIVLELRASRRARPRPIFRLTKYNNYEPALSKTYGGRRAAKR